MGLYLIFQLDAKRLALSVDVIEKVARVVAIRSISQGSQHLQGVIDLQGKVTPVVNCRSLLGLSKKEIELTDMMIICRLKEQSCSLLVDKIENVELCNEQQTESSSSVPLPETISQFIKIRDEVIPVYQLEKLLTKIELPLSEMNNGSKDTT